jgi:putative flippase GtrA
VTTVRRAVPFMGVGALGFALQLATLDLLVRLIGVPYLLAAAIAVELAVVHNFMWHERWTWRDRRQFGGAATLQRLVRFNVATGVVSIVGNVLLTAFFVEAVGLPVVPANVAAVASLSLVNFVVADRWVFRRLGPAMAVAAGGFLTAGAATADAAELKTETIVAFDDYVARTETRLRHEASDPARFLAVDFVSSDESAEFRARVRRGEILVVSVETTAADGRTLDVPSGLIHHWRGAVFIPGVSVDTVIDEIRSPSRRYRQEDVLEARLTNRSEGVDHLFLKIQRQQIVTVAYNTEHVVTYTRDPRGFATSRSVSTRIAEIENYGTPAEGEKPIGDDRGFLWRMNSYWKYQPYQNGVIVELESITLSRSLPWGLRTIAQPIIDRVARESLARTLTSFAQRFAQDAEGTQVARATR